MHLQLVDDISTYSFFFFLSYRCLVYNKWKRQSHIGAGWCRSEALARRRHAALQTGKLGVNGILTAVV